MLWRRCLKNKVLFSIYTGEYPNQYSGGPNNIIYKIINNYNATSNFEFDFLSRDIFIENLVKDNLKGLSSNLSPKKKVASIFAEKSKLYRKFFGSDFYLPYHFYKNERYFKSFERREMQYDIIHSQDSLSLSLFANTNIKAKKILTIHSKGPLSDEIKNMAKGEKLKNGINEKLKSFEVKSIELADLITFPSKAAQVYFEKSLNFKLDESKVKIVYNGIDFDLINNIADDGILNKYSIKKENKLLLMNIAGDAPEKNIDILLKAVGKIKNKFNRDVKLINVGINKEDSSKYLDIAIKSNISNNIIFLGKLENSEVIKLLKATDMFVMTSEKVIFDLVVLEALACGACCVVSNEGGNKEIIKEGENGFLIDINDVDEIAKKIISIIPYKDNVKGNAIKTAKQFTVQKMVSEYFEIYENLLNGV